MREFLFHRILDLIVDGIQRYDILPLIVLVGGIVVYTLIINNDDLTPRP